MILVCPKCKRELAVNGDFYHCQNCGCQWPIKEGIGLFCLSRYWGEIKKEEMSEVLAMVEEKGIAEGAAIAAKKYPAIFKFSSDPSRADWRFYLPFKSDWRVLDAGCGLGGIALALAKTVKEVVAFDSSLARVKFVNLKSQDDDLGNLKTFVADFDSLPLAESQFDLVVMNGVLEWSGVPNAPKNPRTAQKEVLEKCLGLLKPGGYLYIGIENRFASNYLTGGFDHSGLRFTSWLPRRLADAYTRLRLKKPYRAYTYGKKGYEKLLKEAGFSDWRFFLPEPGYNFAKYIIPYDNLYCLQYAVNKLISPNTWRKILIKKLANSLFFLRIYRQLFFSFSIIARKK